MGGCPVSSAPKNAHGPALKQFDAWTEATDTPRGTGDIDMRFNVDLKGGH